MDWGHSCNRIQRPGSDLQQSAKSTIVVRDQSTSFQKLFLLFHKNKAIRKIGFLVDGPFVFHLKRTWQRGVNSLLRFFWRNGESMEKFRIIPCVPCTTEIQSRAENGQFRLFMVCMVTYSGIMQPLLQMFDFLKRKSVCTTECF